MASSSADAHSQPKRPPAPMVRQSSTSSQMSQSQSLSDSQHRPAPPKGQRQHVVGQSRVQRSASGKNLPKLNKNTQARADDGTASRHHRRQTSGNSNSAPSSPRPGFKRNASTGGAVRVTHQPHAHAAIRKNLSSGHLSRQGHSKNMLKLTRNDNPAPKRGLVATARPRDHSPDAHPTVHFDVGDDDEEHEDGWTEASASQSPATTRSNTRSNSVVIEPQKAVDSSADHSTEEETSHAESSRSTTQPLPDRTRTPQQSGGEANHRSRPPDADMITSRLLRRTSTNNPPPQMSSVAATVVSNAQDARVLSQSGGSTLVDTPGRDLVSRFMDAGSSAGTPKGSSGFLPSRASPQNAGGDFDQAKRNKSMPNFADRDTGTPARTPPRRSGTSTPTDLPPSRTQQKLMLQRASSNIEPQKLIPAILPRTGAPNGYVQPGMTFASGEGRLDPRLQQQFNHVAVEYKVVRRFRNPIADSILRIQQMPGIAQKSRAAKSARTNGVASVHGTSSLSTSFTESGMETMDAPSRRSRVSFENTENQRDEGDVEGRQSYGSENERIRNEAEEICRRLWESTEAVGGE